MSKQLPLDETILRLDGSLSLEVNGKGVRVSFLVDGDEKERYAVISGRMRCSCFIDAGVVARMGKG